MGASQNNPPRAHRISGGLGGHTRSVDPQGQLKTAFSHGFGGVLAKPMASQVFEIAPYRVVVVGTDF